MSKSLSLVPVSGGKYVIRRYFKKKKIVSIFIEMYERLLQVYRGR
jgi:hypothetical protein